MNNHFETRNRNLEQFLYVHEIRHIGFYKDNDHMTVWQYERTPELDRVVNEWCSIAQRRKHRKGKR